MDTFQQAGAVATKTIDRWAWWRAALANPGEIGKSIIAHPSEPQQGYFRTRRKNGPWEPVAIFYPEGSDALVAYRNGQEVDPVDIWTWCLRYPISYEAYEKAIAGKGWDDDDPTVAAQIGHNSGDIGDAEVIRDQIEAAKKGASAYEKITDDDTLKKAQSLRARLNELANEADKKRDALKRPHLEAGKAIDKEWMPLVKDAKAAADAIRKAMSAYETEKLRKQRQAEESARKAAEAQQQETAAPPAPIKGSYGKAASVQVKLKVTGVTDWNALSAYMLDHPEMRDLLMKLAQRAVDAGRTVPGVTVQEEALVR